MWRDGYGMMGDWGFSGFFFHGFFWLIVLALAVVGIVLLLRALSRDQVSSPAARRSAGLDALEERYARGEIKRDEFLEKKRDLLG